MATSVVNPRAQFFANNGRPLIGGRIHTYVAGSSTRARTYKDAAKAQPNTNPIILDGRGEAQIYLAEGVEYKFVVEDSNGALIYTQEPVYGAIWPNAADWPSDATLAFKYAMQAETARYEAYAAVESIGVVHFFDKYADYAGGISAGEIVEIANDETRNNFRTRYKIQIDGSLQYLVTLPSQSSIRHAIFSYPDYAAASAAAATLPDGQLIVSDYDEVRGVVSAGTITQEQSIYKVADYAKIRSYTGRGTRLRVADQTGAHWWVRRGSRADNGGTVLKDTIGRSWEREGSSRVNPRWFGATGDGVTDDAPAIQNAIDSLKPSGGTVGFDDGIYFVNTSNPNYACLWVSFDNVTLEGNGRRSIIKVANNKHVPIHACSTKDLTVASIDTAEILDFSVKNLCVVGTGVYENYGLAFGRGILMRKVRNAAILDNFIFDMSMIGICSEAGSGNFIVSRNIVGNCKYTAINYNGRCYQSIISNNICYGSDAAPDTIAIQATGHCIIESNTVYGSPGGYANCGGIMWGEGNYHGVGQVRGNIVKHCRFGIRAQWHGQCQITDNTVVNCLTLGGILCIGGTDPGFTVSSSDNIISGNNVINCYPYQIYVAAKNNTISNNRVIRLVDPKNPSAATEPDTIIDIVPEYGIYVGDSGNSLIGNIVRGSSRGFVFKQGVSPTVFCGNDVTSLAAPGLVAVESDNHPGTICALMPLHEKKSAGNNVYVTEFYGPEKPSQGFLEVGTRWDRSPLIVGQAMGEAVISVSNTTSSFTYGAGVANLTLTGVVTSAAGNVIGIELDNGTYHWTTASAFSGGIVTIAAPIPAGRSVIAGARVHSQQWRQLATLA